MPVCLSNFALQDLFYVYFIVWSLPGEVPEEVLIGVGPSCEGTEYLPSNLEHC